MDTAFVNTHVQWLYNARNVAVPSVADKAKLKNILHTASRTDLRELCARALSKIKTEKPGIGARQHQYQFGLLKYLVCEAIKRKLLNYHDFKTEYVSGKLGQRLYDGRKTIKGWMKRGYFLDAPTTDEYVLNGTETGRIQTATPNVSAPPRHIEPTKPQLEPMPLFTDEVLEESQTEVVKDLFASAKPVPLFAQRDDNDHGIPAPSDEDHPSYNQIQPVHQDDYSALRKVLSIAKECGVKEVIYDKYQFKLDEAVG